MKLKQNTHTCTANKLHCIVLCTAKLRNTKLIIFSPAFHQLSSWIYAPELWIETESYDLQREREREMRAHIWIAAVLQLPDKIYLGLCQSQNYAKFWAKAEQGKYLENVPFLASVSVSVSVSHVAWQINLHWQNRWIMGSTRVVGKYRIKYKSCGKLRARNEE